jgi:hypothetical protein
MRMRGFRPWKAALILAPALSCCSAGCGVSNVEQDAHPSDSTGDGVPCPEGMTDCDGTCVDTSADHGHCGGCTRACDAAEVCFDGECVLECPAGLVGCSGSCVDTATSNSHCGGCGNACSSVEQCREGSCRLMLKIRSVRTGTATMAGSSVSVDIAEIDRARSFLVFSASPDEDDATCGFVRGQITGSTQLTFTRDNRYGECDADFPLRWYVAEFTGGVTVQRGTQDQGGDVTLRAVDPSKSFPIISYSNEGGNIADDDFVRARLENETTLGLTGGGTNTVIEWQVVSIDDVTVRTGDVSLAAGDEAVDATVEAVEPARSWLVYTYTSSGGTPNGELGEKLIQGLITDPTTLSFDRELTGSSHDVTYYVVEFDDWTAVQHGSQPFTATSDESVVLSEVDVTTSLAAGGYVMMVGKSRDTRGENLGEGWFRLDLEGPTALEIHRSRDDSPAVLGWFVVDFAGLRP